MGQAMVSQEQIHFRVAVSESKTKSDWEFVAGIEDQSDGKDAYQLQTSGRLKEKVRDPKSQCTFAKKLSPIVQNCYTAIIY